MPDLHFSVESIAAAQFTAVPQLDFELHVQDRAAEQLPIQSVLLRAQIRIEPTRRSYETAATAPLVELFGEPRTWGKSMRSLLWTHAATVVEPFHGDARFVLPVPCSYDFNIAATKYFDALRDGQIPLCLLFSGTVFYQHDDQLQASQISWEREANCRLPAEVWRELIERFYPNTAWLALRKDTFNRLAEYKSRHLLPDWEQVVEQLMRLEPENARV